MGPVNWLAVVLGTLAFFAVGALWYGVLFGKPWRDAVGISPDKPMDSGGKIAMTFGLALLLEFVVVAMLGHQIARTAPADWGKMMFAVGFGLTIMTPAIGITYLFMNKPLSLFLIDAGHFIVGMAAVGAVFVLLG